MQQWTCMVEDTKKQDVQCSKKFGKYATVNFHGRRYKKKQHVQHSKKFGKYATVNLHGRRFKKSNMYSILKNSGNMRQWTCMVEGTKTCTVF